MGTLNGGSSKIRLHDHFCQSVSTGKTHRLDECKVDRIGTALSLNSRSASGWDPKGACARKLLSIRDVAACALGTRHMVPLYAERREWNNPCDIIEVVESPNVVFEWHFCEGSTAPPS